MHVRNGRLLTVAPVAVLGGLAIALARLARLVQLVDGTRGEVTLARSDPSATALPK